ncbi:MAG: beta-galactosidase, partial [Clostridia bacterium]|nr:beta-galactosidase [Clostridia bacterium]
MKINILNSSLDIPRLDYPRPQWARENWYCLNGEWDFAFDFGKSGEERGMVNDGEYPHKILVPFCPESKLSGIGYTDFISAVWYRRTLTLSDLPEGRCILHFGAVDYFCKVWVNGKLCGTHKGGYTAFEMNITNALISGDNQIVVYAEDDQRSGRQARGKQCMTYKSAGCSYTRTTGI